MNPLLSGLSNVFLGASKTTPMKAPATQNTPNILLQAIGAAMRKESPQQFMENLARSHPQLKQYDFSNLTQAAQQVCQQNGVDMQQAINQIDNITSTLM